MSYPRQREAYNVATKGSGRISISSRGGTMRAAVKRNELAEFIIDYVRGHPGVSAYAVAQAHEGSYAATYRAVDRLVRDGRLVVTLPPGFFAAGSRRSYRYRVNEEEEQ